MPWQIHLIKVVLFFVPIANPDLDPKLHLVKEWFVEFDEDGHPGREIALGIDGQPVYAGPDDRNYGFWLDTDMTFSNFEGDAISAEQFDKKWAEYFGVETPVGTAS